MNKFTFAKCLTGASLVAASFAAHAGFLGQTVEARAFYPDLPPGNSINGGPVSAVVGTGVEFSNGQFGNFFGPSFDFADTSITITHAPTSHTDATFNGYQFFDVNGSIDDIVGVDIISDNSGFFSGNPGRITFDANNIRINFESLNFATVGEPMIELSVRFGNTVPEPGSAALAALALLAAGALRRRAR